MSLEQEINVAVGKEMDRVSNRAKEIMLEELHSSLKGTGTGKLEASIAVEPVDVIDRFVGTHLDYAKYVVGGRKEVKPIRAKVLWGEGIERNIGHPILYAKPVKANDFVGRTADKIRSEI